MGNSSPFRDDRSPIDQLGSAVPAGLWIFLEWKPSVKTLGYFRIREEHAKQIPPQRGVPTKLALGQIAQRTPSGPGLNKFAPAQVVAAGNVFARFADRHV